MNQLRYLYEANIAFHEMAGGIYKLAKDKTGDYVKGGYYTAGDVTVLLNHEDLKVAVFTPRDVFKCANFEL